MRKTLILLAPLSMFAIAACSQTETTDADTADSETTAPAEPMELPPAITSSDTFRCKDGTVVYVDFYQGGERAGVRLDKNGLPTGLTPRDDSAMTQDEMADGKMAEDNMAKDKAGTVPAETGANPTLVGGDYELTGTGDTIQLKLPGKDTQSCSSN